MELFAVLLIVLCYSALVVSLHRHVKRMEDPAYLRAKGVVIHRAEVIESHDPAIGFYMGLEIWAAVTFKGMRYEFDHVAPANAGLFVGPRELFMAPGLVYVTP